ncbi:MAG: flavodoxin [Endomicrobiales bacterium]
MKKLSFTLPIVIAFLGVWGQMNFAAEEINPLHTVKRNEETTRPLLTSKKILVVYFSHSGNTREIANQIHKKTGGDIFEIEPVNPYPRDYDTVVKQARHELDTGYRPALKTKISNINSYDAVFIGYPDWWSTIPAPVRVFLSENNFSGKTLVPFCTHGGSGFGRSITDIAQLCPKSTLLEGIAIRGSDVKTAQNKVSEWLQKIKIMK